MSAALSKALRQRPRAEKSDHQRMRDAQDAAGWCWLGVIVTLVVGAIYAAARSL